MFLDFSSLVVGGFLILVLRTRAVSPQLPQILRPAQRSVTILTNVNELVAEEGETGAMAPAEEGFFVGVALTALVRVIGRGADIAMAAAAGGSSSPGAAW